MGKASSPSRTVLTVVACFMSANTSLIMTLASFFSSAYTIRATDRSRGFLLFDVFVASNARMNSAQPTSQRWVRARVIFFRHLFFHFPFSVACGQPVSFFYLFRITILSCSHQSCRSLPFTSGPLSLTGLSRVLPYYRLTPV